MKSYVFSISGRLYLCLDVLRFLVLASCTLLLPVALVELTILSFFFEFTLLATCEYLTKAQEYIGMKIYESLLNYVTMVHDRNEN